MSDARSLQATQLAVRLPAFQLAANCERVTRRLFVELEVAPLTLPKGMCTDTET
jgi:hypothetical protein